MIYLKLIYIFLLGFVLSLLYYIESIIEKKEYTEKSLLIISMLAFVKSFIGGILIVLLFYALQELNLQFTIFGQLIKFNFWTNLLIAGTLSLFGSDMFKMIKKRVEVLANKEVLNDSSNSR